MTTTRLDRAAMVRRAMVEVVAERGLHGASMSLVAERAGVATGTAYVHYGSKEDLLLAAFVEVKQRLGEAAVAGVDLSGDPEAAFAQVWRNSHDHLAADPAVADFLIQVEASPMKGPAHDALSGDDALAATADKLTEVLVELPIQVVYDLSLAPAVRVVASRIELKDDEVDTLIEACWRAVHRPDRA